MYGEFIHEDEKEMKRNYFRGLDFNSQTSKVPEFSQYMS
jgi:hypothetical protein